jgi:hypothetical protein
MTRAFPGYGNLTVSKHELTSARLYQFLTDGKHHRVKLSGEDLERLLIWNDTGRNFLGSYHDTNKQVLGELPSRPETVQPEIVGEKMARELAAPAGLARKEK